MGMMARMRSLAPWFILTVGGLFVLFMVLSDSRLMDFAKSQSQNVGSVDGEDISYQEYSTMVETARKNQEANGQQLDESQMDYFRDQVWEAVVSQKLLDKKVKEYGIIVTDEELRYALLGPNPPEFLKRQFTDSTGIFNRQLYEQTIKDPRNKEIIINVENQLKQQMIQQKLQEYVGASIIVGDEEAKENFIKRNIKMRGEFIAIDPNSVPEAEIKISDADLRKYYDEHAEDFKVVNQRKIKYVLFRRQAAQDDTLLVKNNMTEIVRKLKADTASFKSYIQSYSEQPYKRDTLSLATLPKEVRDPLINGTKGEIIGPLLSYEGYVAYKLIDKKPAKNEQVKASHILLKSTGNDAADKKKIDEIYNEVLKGDFAKIASLKSEDGSKSSGGDLGWFGKGQMVKPFEEACFSGKIGQVQKPIKTQFGWHIIKVTGRSNQDFIIEKIVNKIQISATTLDKVYQDAADFAFVAKEGGFESEAKALKYDVIETPPFNEEAVAIAGLGVNKALVKWAFEEGVGEISDVYKFSTGYAVVMISDVIKAGMRPFDEVKEMVKNSVMAQKKLQKAVEIAGKIRNQVGDNGDRNIAKSVWPAARIDTTGEFSKTSVISGVGKDDVFLEAAYNSELNKWSKPLKGTATAFLVKLYYKTKYEPSTFALEKETLKKELIQSKKNQYFSQWMDQLKKNSKIKDNRYLFYR
jgi:peptidyl-prolyl cis-trans isomerase D